MCNADHTVHVNVHTMCSVFSVPVCKLLVMVVLVTDSQNVQPRPVPTYCPVLSRQYGQRGLAADPWLLFTLNMHMHNYMNMHMLNFMKMHMHNVHCIALHCTCSHILPSQSSVVKSSQGGSELIWMFCTCTMVLLE